MNKTIVVAGYGPGISNAVARKFGAEGYAVALVGRNTERLSAGAAALAEAGITAKPFVCDLGDADAVRALIQAVHASLGPIAVLHWNPYAIAARDLITAPLAELRSVLELGLVSLLAGVQEALPDLKQTKGAVLVTGGGLSVYDPAVDLRAVEWNVMGLSVAKAAQHKLVGLLHQKLASDGVYVGEVTVHGIVKGSAFDQGHGTLDAASIAQAFWDLVQGRRDIWVTVP